MGLFMVTARLAATYSITTLPQIIFTKQGKDQNERADVSS
jgi:hypothetical protein